VACSVSVALKQAVVHQNQAVAVVAIPMYGRNKRK